MCVCVASDNYNVVFSWSEVFNTYGGNKIGIIVEADGQQAKDRDDPVALFSAGDRASGRRYVKGLQKIIVMRVK